MNNELKLVRQIPTYKIKADLSFLKECRIEREKFMTEMFVRRFGGVSMGCTILSEEKEIEEPKKLPKYRSLDEDWQISANQIMD